VTAAEPSLFDQVGAARLRAMVADFYERVFADVMIGFLFVGKDRAHPDRARVGAGRAHARR
jgi:truncated hemoglobin YjbI